MAEGLILVEGRTEFEFVALLNEHLQPKNLQLKAKIVDTKRSIGGAAAHQGGITSYGKLKNNLLPLFNASHLVVITTMIDYYGLPKDFPGYNQAEAQLPDLYQRIGYLEKQWADDVNHSRFLPYLSIHEFEALLFTQPEKIAQEVPRSKEEDRVTLLNIRHQFQNPEAINTDDPPGKRIGRIFPEYSKRQHGFPIAIEIGITAMRRECPHFDAWLTKLEALVE